MTIIDYMNRAGIDSRRELSRRTGIAHSTLDAIIADPNRARVYQMASIADACRMSSSEVGELVRRA